jgi:hypothetical protein
MLIVSFDVDLPIDCDDEYWEHPDPEKRWKQPPGKPSLVAAFLCTLKLNQVLAFSLRTIVSPEIIIVGAEKLTRCDASLFFHVISTR